jgi:hypothetical protein
MLNILVIRELQTETTMRYLFKPTRMAIILIIGKIRTLLLCWWQVTLENHLTVPQNVKQNYHMTQQFYSQIYTKEYRKHIFSQKLVYKCSHHYS